MNRTLTLVMVLSLPALVGGCKTDVESNASASAGVTVEPTAAAANEEAHKKPGPAGEPTVNSKVARIVFVDKGKACACTQKNIDASWKALTSVVGFPPVPDVERIHMDQAPNKAAPYKAKRPIMVPPAIYFFGKDDKLLEVLQGEITVDQIQKVMK